MHFEEIPVACLQKKTSNVYVNDHRRFGNRHPNMALLHGQRFFVQLHFVTCYNKQLMQWRMSFFSQES